MRKKHALYKVLNSIKSLYNFLTYRYNLYCQLYPLGRVMQNKCSLDLQIFHQNAMERIHFQQMSNLGV